MKRARILLVEDDAAITTVIRVAVEGEGAQLDTVSTLAMRDRMLAANRYDAIITDVMLPDGNGLNNLAEIVTGTDGVVTPVIVLSAQNTLDTAVRAEAEGAFDYLPKPFDLDELIAALRAAVNRLASNQPAESPRTSTAGGAVPIVGRAEAMQRVYRTLARVAPTDLSVLILGESGTGKELVAEAIHD
ncbi:MAG: response regulator, partial [Sphingopyxis sp.]